MSPLSYNLREKMLDTLQRIKKIKDIERLIELQKLEELKHQIQTVKGQEKKLLLTMEQKLKKIRGYQTFMEIDILRREVKKLRQRENELKEVLKQQEEKIKRLNLENKTLSKFMEKLKERKQIEETRQEIKNLSQQFLLKKTYGSFLSIVFLTLVIFGLGQPIKAQENQEQLEVPPYQKILLEPYLDIQNKEFNQLAEKLLQSFLKLNEKEKLIEEKKEFLLKKEEEIKQLLQQIFKMQQQEEEERKEKIKKLLEIIQKADPDSAGEILSQTKPSVAAEVLLQLPNPRRAGEILSSMDPQAAARVIDLLVQKKKQTQLAIIRKKIEDILKYVEE